MRLPSPAGESRAEQLSEAQTSPSVTRWIVWPFALASLRETSQSDRSPALLPSLIWKHVNYLKRAVSENGENEGPREHRS